MSLFCDAGGYDTDGADWWWYQPAAEAPLATKRSRKCCSCGQKAVRSTEGLGVTRTTEKGTDVAELHPELAKAKAQSALQFLAAFDGEDFGFMGEDKPGPHDRRHLAIALDHIQELGAMVLNLADRVTHNA